MKKSFNSEADMFPFTQDEFAYMMLSMLTYDHQYPEYKEPYDVLEFSP